MRDRRKANLAFLAKLAWFMIKDEDSLWVEVLQKKTLKA